MKTRLIQLIAGLAMMVLCISTCTTITNAALIWEDDFSDPNLPGWTIYGYIYTGYGDDPDPIEGNISVVDGKLTSLDDDCNIARHNSTTNVGTWSFDMFVPDDDVGNIYVEFLSNGSSFTELGNGSFIAIGAYLNWGQIVVWSIVGSGWTVVERIDVDPLQGWHHIDVSRNSTGFFLVALNGVLKANFTSLLVTSSTYLQFLCNGATGAAIDNLVVDDDPDEFYNHLTSTTTTTPTDGTTPPPDGTTILIIAGVGIAVVVIVLVVVFAKRR
jgi:hypothetical protein